MPWISGSSPVKRGPDQTYNAPAGIFKPPTASPGAGSGEAAPPRTRGVVSLWSPNTGLRVTARHLEAPQVVQERAGGWEQRERPGRTPRVRRNGSGQLLKVRYVLLLDGYPERSVQKEIDTLRLMGYRDAAKGDVRLLVVGRGPYASGGVRKGSEKEPPDWVVDRLEIVEELHRFIDGAPVRATATVELLEYVEGDAEVRRLKATKATGKPWLKGDTLAKFAKRHLGQSSAASLIRAANPSIKSWSKVPAGKLIVVPGRGD
jgi:hypothetical protein